MGRLSSAHTVAPVTVQDSNSLTRTTVDLDGSWAIGDKIHGGYLLMQVVRAAIESGGFPHPLGVSAHFASAPDPGPG